VTPTFIHASRPFENEDFSRDPQAVQARDDDPLIANEKQPIETLAELVRADERLKNEFPLFTLPLLILHGTADKATKPSGSQFFSTPPVRLTRR
jgi:alpha-beta hydrolase superfamily lysophospholipase